MHLRARGGAPCQAAHVAGQHVPWIDDVLRGARAQSGPSREEVALLLEVQRVDALADLEGQVEEAKGLAAREVEPGGAAGRLGGSAPDPGRGWPVSSRLHDLL